MLTAFQPVALSHLHDVGEPLNEKHGGTMRQQLFDLHDIQYGLSHCHPACGA